MKRYLNVRVGIALLAMLGLGAGVIACGSGSSDNKSSAASQQAAPAQSAQVSANLFIDADTVRGSTGIATEQKAAKSCVQASKFPLGGQVVWRIKVVDPKTGAEMDDKALTSLTVTLSDGQVFVAKYGGHPASAPVESFWAVSWTIPANYPTGSVDYTITAKDKEGRTGEWHQFKVASAMLQVVATDPLALINGVETDQLAAAR